MRHVVIAYRIDLRGMEISSRTRITEILAVLLSIAIVLMDVEVGADPVPAGQVAAADSRAARRQFSDEGAPISELGSCFIAGEIGRVLGVSASLPDVLGRYPNVAVAVGHCRRVIAPSCHSSIAHSIGLESRITGKSVFRANARTGQPYIPSARVDWAVSRTGKIVRPSKSEHHGRYAIGRHTDGREQHIFMGNRHVTLIVHAGA